MKKEDSRTITKLVKMHTTVHKTIDDLIKSSDEDYDNCAEEESTISKDAAIAYLSKIEHRIQMIIGIAINELEDNEK